MKPAAAVARYDELHALIDPASWSVPPDPALTAAAAPLVAWEAALLDDADHDRWLAWWHPEGALWVPLDPAAHPASDQSLFCDDVRRLGERIAWRRDRSAWGQQPPSVTVRVVGSVQAWARGERIVVRSALLIDERRRGSAQRLAGHQIHEFSSLDGAERSLRSKIVLVPALRDGVRNPSFLL